MTDLKTKFASCEQICDLWDLENYELKDKTTNLVSKYLSDLTELDSLVEETVDIYRLPIRKTPLH